MSGEIILQVIATRRPDGHQHADTPTILSCVVDTYGMSGPAALDNFIHAGEELVSEVAEKLGLSVPLQPLDVDGVAWGSQAAKELRQMREAGWHGQV